MKTAALYFCFCLIFISCTKDSDDPSMQTASHHVTINSFPLAIGNSWKYTTEVHVATSSGNVWYNDYYDSYWNVETDTLINGENAFKMAQRDSNLTSGDINLGYTYYVNRPDGFFEVAQDEGNGLYLRKKELFFPDILGSAGFGFRSDTVWVPDTALQFMKFPSNLNDIWNSFEYYSQISHGRKRQWVGFQTVNTPAGNFDCIKLEMFEDINSDNIPDSGSAVVFQYFNTKGLIQVEEHASLSFNGNDNDTLNRITKLVWVGF